MAPVAVATAAVASVALALTDRVGQATVGRRRERVWILLGLLVVVLAAALAVALQQARTPDAAYTPLPGLVDPSVRPPWEPPVTTSPTPTPTPSASLSPTPTATSATTSLSTSPATTLSPTTTLPEAPTLDAVVSQLLVGLWWLIWLAVLSLVLLRAWVALAWWRFRRRCHAGAPAAQVVGRGLPAARLRPLGQPLAPSLSPDDLVGVPAEPDAATEASPADSTAVRDLAALVVPAAFAAHAAPTKPEVAEAGPTPTVPSARPGARRPGTGRLAAWFSHQAAGRGAIEAAQGQHRPHTGAG